MIGARLAMPPGRLATVFCAFALAGAASLAGSVAAPSTFVAAPPVLAQSVPELAGQVTDDAGVVQGRTAEIAGALDTLLGTRGVQLYVAFVPTTGGEQPTSFTRSTFEHNGLGGNDLLLLVAVQDQRYAWWDNGAVPSLQSTEIDQLLSQTLEPRFRANDYAGGVIDFAGSLVEALGAADGGTGRRDGPRHASRGRWHGRACFGLRAVARHPGRPGPAARRRLPPVGVVASASDRPHEGRGTRPPHRRARPPGERPADRR